MNGGLLFCCIVGGCTRIITSSNYTVTVPNQNSNISPIRKSNPKLRQNFVHRHNSSHIYLLADHAEPCSATVPSQHWAAEKQTWKLSPSFSPLPTHVTWRASSYQAQTSWAAELPVPCNHFFYALSMIMVGYVGVPCLYQQTLQNKGEHDQLLQLAHNNKTFQVRERSRFQSPESGPKHEAGRLARIIIMWHASKLYWI